MRKNETTRAIFVKAGFSAAPDLIRQAKEYAKLTDVPFSRLVADALKREIGRIETVRKYRQVIDEAVDGNVPLDDLKSFIKSKTQANAASA